MNKVSVWVSCGHKGGEEWLGPVYHLEEGLLREPSRSDMVDDGSLAWVLAGCQVLSV